MWLWLAILVLGLRFCSCLHSMPSCIKTLFTILFCVYIILYIPSSIFGIVDAVNNADNAFKSIKNASLSNNSALAESKWDLQILYLITCPVVIIGIIASIPVITYIIFNVISYFCSHDLLELESPKLNSPELDNFFQLYRNGFVVTFSLFFSIIIVIIRHNFWLNYIFIKASLFQGNFFMFNI